MEKHKGVSNRTEILAGLKLAYERLLAEKQREDSPLIISRDGKVVRVKPWEEWGDALQIIFLGRE